MIKFDIFPKNVLAVLSEKQDGSMKLKAGLEQEQNDKNRSIFFKNAGIPGEKVVSAHLVHGKKIAMVDEDNWGERIDGVDALITKSPNVYLSVTVADCLPVFLYDPVEHVTAAVHAGWRGLQKKIIPMTIKKMERMGSSPKDILAAVGPGIGPCHFEVGSDVANAFSEYENAVQRREEKIYVDLKEVAKEQLTAAGLIQKNMQISPECTFDNQKFFSTRRDRPEMIQAMVAAIGAASDKAT